MQITNKDYNLHRIINEDELYISTFKKHHLLNRIYYPGRHSKVFAYKLDSTFFCTSYWTRRLELNEDNVYSLRSLLTVYKRLCEYLT